MAMFPVFMIGLLAGAILATIYITFRKETDPQVKTHLQQAEIIRLNADIEVLKAANEELEEELKWARMKNEREEKESKE